MLRASIRARMAGLESGRTCRIEVGMERELRILNIEDSKPDGDLLLHHLLRAGYQVIFERVETPADMRAALEERQPDVILCACTMPHFSAAAALAILRETGLDVPFILISGIVGEERAVQAMLAGAHDYLMKDNLARLVPALERELHEAENRRGRRVAEAALKASEAELRAVFAAMTGEIFLVDADGRYARIVPTKPTRLGDSSTERIGKTLDRFFPIDKADFFIKEVRCALQERKMHRVKYALTIDGKELWFEGSVSPMTEESAIWVARDITERKLRDAEQTWLSDELRGQRERLRNIVASVPGVVWEAWGQPDAATQRIDFVSDYVETMLGYSVEEWLSTPNFWLSIVHPDDRERTAQAAAAHFLSEKSSNTRQFRWVAKDGRVVWVESTSAAIRDNEGRPVGLRGVTIDIGERKRAEEALCKSEERLRQSQKLEAVGRLAGGVAHDFNNLLTVIDGYSALAAEQLKEADPLRLYIDEIRHAGERGASLARQLLAFSRKQVVQPKVVDLNSVVSEMEKMLRRLIGEDIKLRTILRPDVGYIKADPGQIEQVLMNLAVNARDAMPDGGRLTIETANVVLDQPSTTQHVALAPAPSTMLAVSDTGIGMDKETQAHIFEPFFTTKEPGRGTGLGLFTVYGIVNQSGGKIWVYSEPDRGTAFKIYFPQVEEGAQACEPIAESAKSLRGSETILLAEDDELVRSLVREVLKSLGYQVLEAPNGGAALLICERHQRPIHLLLTDIVMPEIGGRELANRLLALHPEMRVLYVSGYTGDGAGHHGIPVSETMFLPKPFTPNTLARKLREVLD